MTVTLKLKTIIRRLCFWSERHTVQQTVSISVLWWYGVHMLRPALRSIRGEGDLKFLFKFPLCPTPVH